MKKITVNTEQFGQLSGEFNDEQEAKEIYASELGTDVDSIEIVSVEEMEA